MNHTPILHEEVTMKTGKKGVVTNFRIASGSHKPCSFTVKLEDGEEIFAVPSDFKKEG